MFSDLIYEFIITKEQEGLVNYQLEREVHVLLVEVVIVEEEEEGRERW